MVWQTDDAAAPVFAQGLLVGAGAIRAVGLYDFYLAVFDLQQIIPLRGFNAIGGVLRQRILGENAPFYGDGYPLTGWLGLEKKGEHQAKGGQHRRPGQQPIVPPHSVSSFLRFCGRQDAPRGYRTILQT